MEKQKVILSIINGRVLDPVSGRDETADIRIEDGRITAVGPHLPAPEKGTVIDAAGLTVSPGLCDGHVHFRDPGYTYKEDIKSGSAAAAAGGFTTVVCMANTNPVTDNVKTLSYILQKGERCPIHLYQTAAVTADLAGKQMVDMQSLSAAGAVGFTDDGIAITDAALLREAMRRAKALCRPIALHEEDPAYVSSPGVNAGSISERLGCGGASHLAEEVLVQRDCALAEETGARLLIQHISSGRSVDLVREAKRRGADVHAEATPHHFTLTEEDVLRYGTYAKMNPPLRSEDDRRRIIEGLCDGTIDMIATDHAPHSAEEKARPFLEAPSGIIGLETSLSLAIRSLVQPHYLSLMQVLSLMSKGPMEFYGLTPPSVTEGAEADLVIFGENVTWRVEKFASKAKNSPFLGWELPGKIFATICDGKIIYRSDDIRLREHEADQKGRGDKF